MGRRERPLGADVPRCLRGGSPQPGRHDLVRGPQRAAGHPRGAHVRRLARPRGAHARARRAPVHRRRAPSGRRLRPARRELLHRARLHQPAHRAGPRRHPAAAPTAATRTRSSSPAATAAFNPEPIAEFIDAAVLGDGEQAVLEISDVVEAWKREGRPGGRDELLLRLAAHRRGLRAAVLRRRLPARRAHPPGGAQPLGRPVAGRQAHGDGPRRVALPQAAAGAARRDRPRADERRDLPRLHPRLPVLPGRDDHPPGARALDHRHRRDGRARSGRVRLRGGRPAQPLERRPLRDRRGHQGPGRPLRGHQHQPVAAEHPRRRVQRRPRQRAVAATAAAPA